MQEFEDQLADFAEAYRIRELVCRETIKLVIEFKSTKAKSMKRLLIAAIHENLEILDWQYGTEFGEEHDLALETLEQMAVEAMGEPEIRK